jgi:nicotinamidase-related amidase
MKPLRIKKEDAVLLVIDFQEKLMPAMKDSGTLGQTVAKMIRGCRILGVPIIVTQQYTKGLGQTVPVIQTALDEERTDMAPSCELIEKTSFSCCGAIDFVDAVRQSGKKTILVTGIESHICVQQTVLDLLEGGYGVFLINDCIASRSNIDKKFAQRRMGDAGAVGTTYESALFEMCVSAGAPEFKAISALVK